MCFFATLFLFLLAVPFFNSHLFLHIVLLLLIFEDLLYRFQRVWSNSPNSIQIFCHQLPKTSLSHRPFPSILSTRQVCFPTPSQATSKPLISKLSCSLCTCSDSQLCTLKPAKRLQCWHFTHNKVVFLDRCRFRLMLPLSTRFDTRCQEQNLIQWFQEDQVTETWSVDLATSHEWKCH